MEGQGQGGGFNGQHDVYGRSGACLGNDERTMDLFGPADASAGYNFGVGSSTVHHPQLHGGSSRHPDPSWSWTTWTSTPVRNGGQKILSSTWATFAETTT
jgi:hypothetical protein